MTVAQQNGQSLATLYAKRNPHCTAEQLVNSYFVTIAQAREIIARLGRG